MKCAIAILLVFASSQVVYGQSKGSPASRDKSHAQATKKPDPEPPPSNTVVVVKQETSNTQGDGTKNDPKSYLARLFAPENLPNIALFFVGVSGIIVALCTLKIIQRQTEHIARQAQSMRYQTTILRESAAATRKAAEATEKSVTLQETAMRQWVDVEDLRARSDPTFFSGMTEAALVFTFHVKNPTKIPLTFEWLIVRANQQRYAMTFHHFLPPDDIYPIKIPITIRNKQVEEYGSSKLVLSFIATVGYTDAFEKPQRQPFGVMCLLGPQGQCNVSPYEGALPDDELEKQKQPEGAN